MERGRRVGGGEVVVGMDEVEEERRICRRRMILGQLRKEWLRMGEEGKPLKGGEAEVVEERT